MEVKNLQPFYWSEQALVRFLHGLVGSLCLVVLL